MTTFLKPDTTPPQTFTLPTGDKITIDWIYHTVEFTNVATKIHAENEAAAEHNDELLRRERDKLAALPTHPHPDGLDALLKEFNKKQTEADANADADDALNHSEELIALVQARRKKAEKEAQLLADATGDPADLVARARANMQTRINKIVKGRDPSHGRAKQLPLPLSDVREGFKMHPNPKPYLFPGCPREGTSHQFALQAVKRIFAETQQPVCCQAVEAGSSGQMNMLVASGALSDLFLRGFLMRKSYHCGCANCAENTKPLFHYVMA